MKGSGASQGETGFLNDFISLSFLARGQCGAARFFPLYIMHPEKKRGKRREAQKKTGPYPAKSRPGGKESRFRVDTAPPS